jgi:IS1 family transposase
MKKLDPAKRRQIIAMLCEGSSMRSISRLVDVSINTVTKLLADAGEACEEFHDKMVRNVQSKRVQCDEIWAFVDCTAKSVEEAKAAPQGAGDCWTWTAIDADTKLMISWVVGGRDAGYAHAFIQDVAARLANRFQLTTDGHKAYLEAVETAFGADIDHATLVNLWRHARPSGALQSG